MAGSIPLLPQLYYNTEQETGQARYLSTKETNAHDDQALQQPQLTHPTLSWNEQGLPVADDFDDPYFSVENGLEETRYVFLKNNGLPERWSDRTNPFRIIETGFGTGLNFLATWQMFREQPDNNAWLHFTSIEKFPLSREQLNRALLLWPDLGYLAEKLIDAYPPAIKGFHTLRWPEERVTLTLIFDDVHQALPELKGPVDAWFLDGFAPSKNPAMWSDALFSEIRRISRNPRADRIPTVATFTAAGIVRRGLKGAGFNISKVPGFGRKREMLAGRYAATAGPEKSRLHNHLPWQLFPAPLKNASKVIVAGAGLAGCTTARALAERGFQVTLCDPQGIANGASGNPQGGLYIKLAADDQATHSDFYRQAYLLALKEVERILGAPAENNKTWNACGVLQLAYSAKEEVRQQRFIERHQPPAEFVAYDSEKKGLIFPAAGWVSPADFCRALVNHSDIQLITTTITNITGEQNALTITTDSGDLDASAIVIATAHHANELAGDNSYLPTKKIRGQLTYLNADAFPTADTVLCARSYMAPPVNGRLVLGATYNLKDEETELRDSDHQTNLSHLCDFGSEWEAAANSAEIIGGRVGFRCTTPDYLPMAGPLVVKDEFVKRFRPMTKNAKRIPREPMPWMSGVWLNIGHGSRGLASSSLCAELIAEQMTGDAVSTSQTVADALSPNRFLLRNLIRNKL
tara:strand:+ start:2074 stop:4149 length:2076 start_codon:yes stop_codon:yes gene_type:complete